VAGEGPRTITKRNVLAVEGEDDRNFFEALLRHMGIVDVQIEPVGGKDQFKNKLPALPKTPGFFDANGVSFVRHLAIVRDKGDDHAFESIANIVKAAGFTPPLASGRFSDGAPRVGIFIMPGQGVYGTMLEDLCLETVKNHPAMDCVGPFAECIRGLTHPPRSPSKAKCQAFLAAQVEIANAVGVGALKGYWNLNSPALDGLKGFLSQMRC
jgi:hypothetical protein